MVKKRCAKGAQKEKGISEISPTHCYPDKIGITNLLCRGLFTQLKGGYIQ